MRGTQDTYEQLTYNNSFLPIILLEFPIGRHGNPRKLLWREKKDQLQIASLSYQVTYMSYRRRTEDPLLILKQGLMQKVFIGLNTFS